MNIKSLIPTSFGLGLCIFLISYVAQIILNLMGVDGAAQISSAAGSMAGAMVFTYFFYPYLMSRSFKLYAVLYLFAITILALIISLFVLGTFGIVSAGLADIMADTKMFLAIMGATLFSFAFQGLLFYFGIHFGNKEGLKMVAAQNKK